MRIAVVTRRFPALSETYTVRQIEGLLKCGHEVDIYAFKGRPQDLLQEDVIRLRLMERTRYLRAIPRERWARIWGALRILCSRDFRHRRLALNIWRYGCSALAARFFWLDRFPEDREYDVIHCQHAHSGVAAAWWRKAGVLHGKILTTFHGGDIVCDASKYARNGYELLFREGDGFTANSMFTANRAIAVGCPEEKIRVWPMGLDLMNYDFRERSMPVGGPVTLLTVSRFAKEKGIEFSIRACALLMRKRPNIEYRIIGDGPERGALEGLINELGLNDRVRLLGWKTEEALSAIYRDAHLFVCPSITDPIPEAQGVVLQEAQACGLPVVATRTGGIPESVVEGQSAFLVPEQDPDALADRIEYLLDRPDIWAEMGRAGRKYVESKFDMSLLTDRLVEIYRSLLHENQGARVGQDK